MVHLREHGFKVDEVEAPSVQALTALRQKAGVPDEISSCHTAQVGRYVVEGHVPADVIDRMLDQQPDIIGIAVPGMPAGSPGMHSNTPAHYDILALAKDGTTTVYDSR